MNPGFKRGIRIVITRDGKVTALIPLIEPDPDKTNNGLADDAIQKLLLGRDPMVDDPIASQPTISRFENGVASQALYEMGRELLASVVERHRRRLHGRARRCNPPDRQQD